MTLCVWQARHLAATAASASQSSFDEADLEVLARSPVAAGSVEELQAEEAVEAIEVRAGCLLHASRVNRCSARQPMNSQCEESQERVATVCSSKLSRVQ